MSRNTAVKPHIKPWAGGWFAEFQGIAGWGTSAADAWCDMQDARRDLGLRKIVKPGCRLCSRAVCDECSMRGKPKVQITAALVQDVRSRTDETMMDCKRALMLANGNVEGALEALRLGRV